MLSSLSSKDKQIIPSRNSEIWKGSSRYQALDQHSTMLNSLIYSFRWNNNTFNIRNPKILRIPIPTTNRRNRKPLIYAAFQLFSDSIFSFRYYPNVLEYQTKLLTTSIKEREDGKGFFQIETFFQSTPWNAWPLDAQFYCFNNDTYFKRKIFIDTVVYGE